MQHPGAASAAADDVYDVSVRMFGQPPAIARIVVDEAPHAASMAPTRRATAAERVNALAVRPFLALAVLAQPRLCDVAEVLRGRR